jgi:hypothetical protein
MSYWDFIIAGVILLAAGLILRALLAGYEWAKVIGLILVVVGAILLVAGVAFLVAAGIPG